MGWVEHLIGRWTKGPWWQSFALSLVVVLPLVLLANLGRAEIHGWASAGRVVATRSLVAAAMVTVLVRLSGVSRSR